MSSEMSSESLVRLGQTDPRDNVRLKYEAPVVDQLSVGGGTAAKFPSVYEGTETEMGVITSSYGYSGS